MQGKGANRIIHYDYLNCFVSKLGLWLRRIEPTNTASFPNLDTLIDKVKTELPEILKSEIEKHLKALKDEFMRYFPDLKKTGSSKWKLTRNPFRISEKNLDEC